MGARDPSSGAVGRAVVLGLVAGFLSGLFGVGGGILVVPVLVLALGMDQRLAHGTSLAAVLPIAVSAVAGFVAEDSVDWAVAAALASGAVVGTLVGTHWLHTLPVHTLAYAFGGILLASAARLAFDHSEGAGRPGLTLVTVAALVLLGLVSGALGGLLGVGGGVVMVPAMVVLFGIPAAVAKGTSLAVVVPMSIVATVRNVRKGNAELPTAAAVGLAGVVSAYGAAKVSVGLDESTSNALFATLLTLVAVRMVVETRRKRRAALAAAA